MNSKLAVFALLLTQLATAAPPAAPSSGIGIMPGGNTRNVGGVIDRPVSRALNSTAPETTATQFNRLADHTAFTPAPEAAVEPEGAPALYTILQRPTAASAKARPVAYALTMKQRAAPKAAAHPSNKHFCTVTEVARSISAACR